MKRVSLLLASLLVVVLFLMPARAQAGQITIGFEDLTSTVNGVPQNYVPPNYMGFQWTPDFSWVLATPTSNNSFSAKSGNNYAYANSGVSALTFADGTFDFNSMWAMAPAGQLPVNGSMSVTVHAYRKDTTGTEIEVANTVIHVTGAYSLFTFDSNFASIDKITFDNFVPQTNLILDDITITKNDTVATPEPASLILVGIGAVGLIGYPLRQRKQTPATPI